jgi:glyoxylase-like metal-dependent hydrolase (beta-lactamase superfamily II)
LIEGARAVYGDRFDSLFAPIVPIAKQKVVEVPDGGAVQMSTGRRFEMIHLAGHALHHFAVVDRRSDGVFTGDNAGIRYPSFSRYGFIPALPTTTPSQFDPTELERTMARLVELGVKKFYFTHFSVGTAAEVSECRGWIPRYVSLVKETGANWERLRDRLRAEISDALIRRGVPANAPELQTLALDCELNAKGVALWWEKRAAA